MDKVSEEITAIDIKEELHVCPNCGYQRGFHVSFISKDSQERLALVLICPSCGSRYDVGKLI